TFVVNVTHTSYQAEENQDITLEWTFTTRRETSFSSISTYCFLFTESRPFVLFELRERLRTNDSGFYVCDILVRPDGSNSRRCWLNVTVAEELEPQRPAESPQAESPRGLWLIVVITTLIIFIVSIACIVLIRYKYRTYIAAMQMESSSEEQTIRTYMSPSESVRPSNI
ncbi:hypothetical protein KUCAC02_021954, partial [Chaenocephalus aceratus]